MAGVKFRADQKLKNEIGTIKAKALKANEHSAKLTDKEIDRRLTNYFATRPFMTRNDFQSVLRHDAYYCHAAYPSAAHRRKVEE